MQSSLTSDDDEFSFFLFFFIFTSCSSTLLSCGYGSVLLCMLSMIPFFLVFMFALCGGEGTTGWFFFFFGGVGRGKEGRARNDTTALAYSRYLLIYVCSFLFCARWRP